jgi:acyl-CoA hydrolase
MEIGVKVLAENTKTRELVHIVSAYFTFVAIGKDLRPIGVPQVIPETPAEKRRYKEADIRRQRRISEAASTKKRRLEGI